MKLREINENPEWTFWLPDAIADWDAPSHWERERLYSMQEHLEEGMILYDVGAEHGWMTAVYATFVGPENVALFEPSPDLWGNIRRVWEWNEFPEPLACYQAFVGDETTELLDGAVWPPCSLGPEHDHMAYRHPVHHAAQNIPTIEIDSLDIMVPDAITIDVEGAELLVLLGACTTLKKWRPLVWCSIHPDLMHRDFGHKRPDVLDYMKGLRYEAERIVIDHEEHWLFTPEER